MSSLRIDDPPNWPEDKDKEVLDLMDTAWDVCLLEKGTQEGNPTVTLRLALPDGRFLYTQTTLALWKQATKFFNATVERWEGL